MRVASPFVSLLIAVVTGCTFVAGQPTSDVRISVSASWPQVASAFQTPLGYSVTVESAWLTVPSVTLATAPSSGGGGETTFDPSKPPPGCTLCDNGHCHCGDRLVDYEDLQNAGGAGPTITATYPGPVDVDAKNPAAVALPRSSVPDNAYATLSVDPAELVVTGRVSGQGIDNERFTLRVPDVVAGAFTQSGDLEVSVEREPLIIATMRVTLPEGLFDDVEFKNLETRAGARTLDPDFAPGDIADMRLLIDESATAELTVERQEDLRLLPPWDPAPPHRADLGF